MDYEIAKRLHEEELRILPVDDPYLFDENEYEEKYD